MEGFLILFTYSLQTALEKKKKILSKTLLLKIIERAVHSKPRLFPYVISQVYPHGLVSQEVLEKSLNNLIKKRFVSVEKVPFFYKRKLYNFKKVSVSDKNLVETFCEQNDIDILDYIAEVEKFIDREGCDLRALKRKTIIPFIKVLTNPTCFMASSTRWEKRIVEPGLGIWGVLKRFRGFNYFSERPERALGIFISIIKGLYPYQMLINKVQEISCESPVFIGKTCLLKGRFKNVPEFVEEMEAYRATLSSLCFYEDPFYEIDVYIDKNGIEIPLSNFPRYDVAIVGVYDRISTRVVVKALRIVKLDELPDYVFDKCFRKSVFISYSSADKYILEDIVPKLESAGFMVIIAEREPPKVLPQTLPEKIKRLIEKSDYLVALITVNGLKSHLVHEEVGYALGIKKSVIPLVEKGISHDELALLQGSEYIPLNHENIDEAVNKIISWTAR
jgi:hypothetical protein